MTATTRVLVVDDSAYVRKTIREMLAGNAALDVIATARDGDEALELAQTLKPDVVTVDLVMPGMDGAELTRRLMSEHPVPVVLVTSLPESSDRLIAALDAGAVDFVQKPTALATDRVFDMSAELVAKIRAAAGVPLARLRPRRAVDRTPRTTASAASAVDGIVIGISTGGPQALKHLIPKFPAGFPVPIALVLHMPVGYTELYAHSLNEMSALEVVEAREDAELRAGMVLVGQAGRHMRLIRRADGRIVTQLSLHPLDALHRPSVDVLFESAAAVFGDRVLGIVMTGMGTDGRAGAGWIKAAGGRVLTESEESSVVYGMPRAVVEAGLSDGAFDLEDMAEAILERI